jgi:hypothetical protein
MHRASSLPAVNRSKKFVQLLERFLQVCCFYLRIPEIGMLVEEERFPFKQESYASLDVQRGYKAFD